MPTPATSPRQGFLTERAKSQDISFAEAERRDLTLTTDRNPFNARNDPEAVSRGAVLFQANCIQCHGTKADGAGTELPQRVSDLSFHNFGTRFGVALHHGAPRKWFCIIDQGAEPLEVDWTDEPIVMEGFHDILAREQIWLLVTYLQSLDVDLPNDDEGAPQ